MESSGITTNLWEHRILLQLESALDRRSLEANLTNQPSVTTELAPYRAQTLFEEEVGPLFAGLGLTPSYSQHDPPRNYLRRTLISRYRPDSPQSQLSTLYQPTSKKEDSIFCQQIITSRLRRGFKKLCRQVLSKAGRKQTSHDFTIFAASYHNPGSKFGKGIRTIRQLIEQRVPETLDQVVCCVMLADAMRMAKIREESEVTDESFDEFIQDLPR